MGHLIDTYHLKLDVPHDLTRRPRLLRLGVGTACCALALLLAGTEVLHKHWSTHLLGDPRIAGAALLLVGCYQIAQSLRHDAFRVEHIRFNRTGLHLEWSLVPRLTGTRVTRQQIFQWAELQSVQWLESEHEHALQQYLHIAFHTPIGLHRSHIKLQISEDRNPEHGEKLASFLPANLKLPPWLEAARKNPHATVTPSEAFDEIPAA
jgi:hypothetical protein